VVDCKSIKGIPPLLCLNGLILMMVIIECNSVGMENLTIKA
jgi:hypothetical protein